MDRRAATSCTRVEISAEFTRAMVSGRAMFSRAVSVSSRLESWKIKPSSSRRNCESLACFMRVTSWPLMRIVPLVALSMVETQLSNVDLARARGAHDANEFAAVDGKADVVERAGHVASAPYTFSRCATSSTGVAMCVVCIPSPFLRLVYGIYSRKKTSRLPSIWLTLALPLCKVRVASLSLVDVERGLLLKTVHVAAGIIRKEGSDELLAVQRGYGDMRGLWEFPGGKLMRGESPEDAVRRELMEELQVKVTNLRDFYTVEYDYPDFHLSMECYYCSLAKESGEPQKHDRQLDIRWIPRTSLATVEWMPADKGLIDALIELKEDRLEANGVANDAEATATDEPATKPKRAPKRRSKKRPKARSVGRHRHLGPFRRRA